MFGFTVDFVSPMDFEYLAAEISYDGQVLCRVRNERSDRVLEVELFVDVVRKVDQHSWLSRCENL